MTLIENFAKLRELNAAAQVFDNAIDAKCRESLKLLTKGGVWAPYDDNNHYYVNNFVLNDDGITITCNYDFYTCGESDHNHIEYPLTLIEDPTPTAIEAYRLLLLQEKADKEAANKAAREAEIVVNEKTLLAKLLAKHGPPV